MKLRIRALNSTQTLRIDIPADSSLQHLRQAIAHAVPLSSSSSALRLSLNRADELSASSPSDSLLTLGIAAGDLIFYSLAASDHETLGQISAPANQVTTVEARSEASGSVSVAVSTDCASLEGVGEEEEDEGFGGESMEIDESCKFHESCFVKSLVRVLGQESGNEGFNRKSIVAAVHCVLLESGFVRFDSDTGKKIEGELRFPSLMAFALRLNYTLPAILVRKERQSVVLKFQSLKHFVNVFASLTSGGSGSGSLTYRLCLDERRFAPAIGSLRGGNGGDESEKELYELWKIVRDGLALPLMIDLCAQAGLPGPACFSRLPADLQRKILELLPGDDLARAGCVCKELSYLSSNNSLWKLKFLEEFGLNNMPQRSPRSWKTAFVGYRRSRRREEEVERAARQVWPGQPLFAPVFGFPPNPLELPRIGGIGGDYNHIPGLILPGFGGLILPRFGLQDQNRDLRRPFSPRCNWRGGF